MDANPTPTNQQRADRVKELLVKGRYFEHLQEDELQIAVRDFLADLRHLGRLEGVDVEHAFQSSEMHFREEVEEEAELATETE